MHQPYFRSLAGLVALFAAACDGQQDESYTGEALAEIRGQVTKDPSSTASNVKALVIWNNFAKNGDTSTSVEAPISGSFPARFTLKLTQPPATDALNDFTHGGEFPNETRVGTGDIVAVSADLTDINNHELLKHSGLGVAEHFVVVYAESDVKAGSKTAEFVHGALTKGYHLMKVIPADKSTGEIFDELHEAEGGFATEIELKLASDDVLDYPNYY